MQHHRQIKNIEKFELETLCHIMYFAGDQPQTRLVSRTFNDAFKIEQRRQAKDFFMQFLTTNPININETGYGECLYLITLYAKEYLPIHDDHTKKLAAIGILFLQLFDIMRQLTEKNIITFTIKGEPEVQHIQFQGDMDFDQSVETRRGISQNDLDNLKNDAEDLLAILKGNTVNQRLIAYFPNILLYFLETFKLGLNDVKSDIAISHSFNFFRRNESKAEKIARYTNLCLCLLESELYKLGIAQTSSRCTIL